MRPIRSHQRSAWPTSPRLPFPGRVLCRPLSKGIIHVPAHNTPMAPSRRESLLMAIAKARSWVDELVKGRVGSLAMLARREGKAERHIRLLLPLAFVSPRIVSSILEGTAPAGLTITALARALSWSWAEQERRLAQPCNERPAQ
jgi:site-specific DNA recombinase